jgi:dihydrofolate reductase
MNNVAILHCDRKGLIGTNGTLAYKSREDFQWFKSFTLNKFLVMGRNTYAECGNLTNRSILSLSSNGNLFNGKATEHTVKTLQTLKRKLVFCGGPSVYEKHLPDCNAVIINYTKQPEKSPGLNPSYFNLVQLHELFDIAQSIEYKTFTQVIYKPKKPVAVIKYTSRIHKASLYPLALTLRNGYYLNENSICESGSDEYYQSNEVFDTEAEALAQIYKELKVTQTRLENQLKACRALRQSILIKSNLSAN